METSRDAFNRAIGNQVEVALQVAIVISLLDTLVARSWHALKGNMAIVLHLRPLLRLGTMWVKTLNSR